MTDDTQKRGRMWGLAVAILAIIAANIVALVAVILIAKQVGIAGKTVGISVLATQAILLVATWLVLYFTFIRSRASGRGIVYFLVLLVVTIAMDAGLAGLGKLSGDQRLAANAVRDAAAIQVALSDATNAEIAVTKRQGSVVDFHTQSPGEAGRIARAASTLLKTVSEANAAFDAKMIALGFADLISPKRLAADPGFAKTNSVLKEIRLAIATREQEIDAAIAAFRATLVGARIENSLKRDALASFESRMTADKASRAHETGLQIMLIDEMERTVHDLALDKSSWKITGELIDFSNPRALGLYRRHISKMLALSHQVIEFEK